MREHSIREIKPGYGKRISSSRVQKKWTQEKLAQKAGLTRGVICSYETESNYPTIDSVIAIARALKVSVDYIVGLEDMTGSAALDFSALPEEFRAVYAELIARTSEYFMK